MIMLFKNHVIYTFVYFFFFNFNQHFEIHGGFSNISKHEKPYTIYSIILLFSMNVSNSENKMYMTLTKEDERSTCSGDTVVTNVYVIFTT